MRIARSTIGPDTLIKPLVQDTLKSTWFLCLIQRYSKHSPSDVLPVIVRMSPKYQQTVGILSPSFSFTLLPVKQHTKYTAIFRGKIMSVKDEVYCKLETFTCHPTVFLFLQFRFMKQCFQPRTWLIDPISKRTRLSQLNVHFDFRKTTKSTFPYFLWDIYKGHPVLSG